MKEKGGGGSEGGDDGGRSGGCMVGVRVPHGMVDWLHLGTWSVHGLQIVRNFGTNFFLSSTNVFTADFVMDKFEGFTLLFYYDFS